ncbi:hypothetical protein [Pseudonocardia sp. GCM10023141]|uniref:hypothetical protein n=1 Tax=Pseudonocardia sp. GCM10023141 TaxID=3252653 RepID=UPI00361CB03B
MILVLGADRSRRASTIVAGFLALVLLLTLSAALGCLGQLTAGGASHADITSTARDVPAVTVASMTAEDECAGGHSGAQRRAVAAVPAAAPSVLGVPAADLTSVLQVAGPGSYFSVVADAHSRVLTPLLRLLCVLRT